MAPQEEWRNKPPLKRFVVGSLENMERVGEVIQDLLRHDLPLDSINVLAKQPLLTADELYEALPVVEVTDTNPLASDRSKIVCLGEGFGEILRILAGQDRITLNEILQRRLLPRHARNLSEVVESGGILVWVEAPCPEDEKTVSITLLRNSNATVQVHDFALI